MRRGSLARRDGIQRYGQAPWRFSKIAPRLGIVLASTYDDDFSFGQEWRECVATHVCLDGGATPVGVGLVELDDDHGR
jgi:hypothetical protein